MILYFKYEYERKSILKNSRTEVLSTIHKIYIAIWFLLHVLGYIIQLSFHVVDVNINLDLYKCIWINHRNEKFPKKNFFTCACFRFSLPASCSSVSCQDSLWWPQNCINQIKSCLSSGLNSQNSLSGIDGLNENGFWGGRSTVMQ